MGLIIETWPKWEDTDTDGKLESINNKIITNTLIIQSMLMFILVVGMINLNNIVGYSLDKGIKPLMIVAVIGVIVSILITFFNIRYEKTKRKVR